VRSYCDKVKIDSMSESGVGVAATADGGCPDLISASAEVGPMATN
jgi:hypothetical protein